MSRQIKALILTADKFEDMELFFPYFRLLEEGVDVDIAAPRIGHIEGEHGYELETQGYKTASKTSAKDVK